MIYKNIEQVFEKEKEVFNNLKKSLSGISTEQVEFRDSSQKWNIRQIVEHLALVEEQLVQLITQLLEKTESKGNHIKLNDTPISLESIINLIKNKKFVTKEQFEPVSDESLSNSINRLEKVHKQLNELNSRLQSVNLSERSFPHWIFGKLNLGQWIAFLVHHEQVHLNQIDILTLRKDSGTRGSIL